MNEEPTPQQLASEMSQGLWLLEWACIGIGGLIMLAVIVGIVAVVLITNVRRK